MSRRTKSASVRPVTSVPRTVCDWVRSLFVSSSAWSFGVFDVEAGAGAGAEPEPEPDADVFVAGTGTMAGKSA